jgi:hypothetical protein
MKLLMILAVSAFTSGAFATDLKCRVDRAFETSVGNVAIVNFTQIEGTEFQVKSDLPDQSTMTAFEIANGVASAGFSNECDNEYEVIFPAKRFEKVIAGEKRSIVGKIKYTSADNEKFAAKLLCVVR